ncbi:MAG: sulfatase-like hydrolase/transferase [Tannerella sp.]|jgi:arylsulfatase A-like enzyme|nr:sulfatase-like hydrolase/transferase [Tannerella sp.]
MSKKYIIYSLLTLCALFSIIQTGNANSGRNPNIIYICVSDFGKGLLSAYGQRHFTTPNIDALIDNGTSFSNAYGGSITAYARASLLTGYHDCNKNKWRITNGGVYAKGDTSHIYQNENMIDDHKVFLPENDPYLPRIFQKAGYVTAQIGMLGIGNASTRKQMEQYGWDYYYGYLDLVRSQGYYPPFIFENGQMIMIEGNTRADCGRSLVPETEIAYKERWDMEGKKTYSPDLFINKTIEFIREFKEKPFFLMFSTTLPHGPASVPAVHPEAANNDALTQIEKEYASMVKLLDNQVGQIMTELKSLKLEENTLIVFASDNGHDIYYIQEGRMERPYRNTKTRELFDNSYNKYYSDKSGDIFNGNAGMAGLKYSNLEGGIRIPLVFYWKGKIKKRVCEEIVSGYDFLPTIADLLGEKLKTGKDGISILPVLMKGKKLSKDRYIIVGSEEGPVIVTNEGWKLRYYNGKKTYELYNLGKDPKEKYDVILRFPEKAEYLKKILLKECKDDIQNGVIY